MWRYSLVKYFWLHSFKDCKFDEMSLTYFLVHSQSSNELRQIVGSVDYWFFYLYLKEVMKVWKLEI